MTAEETAGEFLEASEMIMRSSYIDDTPASAESKEAGMKIMNDTETIIESMNFKIKKLDVFGQEDSKG